MAKIKYFYAMAENGKYWTVLGATRKNVDCGEGYIIREHVTLRRAGKLLDMLKRSVETSTAIEGVNIKL